MNRSLTAALLAALLIPGVARAGEDASPPAPAAPGSLLPHLARALGEEPPAPAAEPPREKEPPRWILTGTTDFYYSTNFNDPATGENLFRAFDIKDEDGIHFAFLELAAQRRRTPWGGRIDVDFGPTARLVNFAEPSDDKFWQHVQQLYLSRNLTADGSAYLDFGKFVTSAGAEVIEARDNFLYSRGLLFTWAVPFYHFGFRGFKYFNDTDWATLQVVRGWNNVVENNDDVTFGIGGNKALSSRTNLSAVYYVGPEPDLTGGGSTRHLIDFVLTYKPNHRWTFLLNGDYARQDRFGFGGGRREDVDWMGLAGYARYQTDPKGAITVRGEWLNDSEGASTGFDQNLRSVTVGYSRRVNPHTEWRVEWRRDWSNARVFPDNGGRSRSQDTLLGALILGF